MKAILSALIFYSVCLTTSRAQDHYDPAKALSSEELFLKQYNNKRVFTKAGERYLALDAKPLLGGYHRYRFFPGDKIRFRMKGRRTRFVEEIYTITDSSFTFSFVNEAAGVMETTEVQLSDIRRIKTYRRIPWVTEAAPLLPVAGLTYLAADFFNKGLDGKNFTTDMNTILVSGAFIAGGFVCYKLSFPAFKINGHNRIKVLKTY